jgi:hypothetical protein
VPGAPAGYLLETYPNPAERNAVSQATVRFALPERGHVTLTLHDMIGRTVATVADGSYDAGEHILQLPLRPLRPGGYYCRLISECAASPCRRQILTSMVLVVQ